MLILLFTLSDSVLYHFFEICSIFQMYIIILLKLSVHFSATCPSNPTDLSAFVSSEDDTAFEQLFMPQMKKEEVFTLGKDGVCTKYS